MLPPELSKISKDTFDKAMEGKVKYSERSGVNYEFSDDLYRAVNAAVEAVLWDIHKQMQ